MFRTLQLAPAATVLIGLAFAIHGSAFAQNDRADIRYETVSPRSIGLAATYRLAFRTAVLPNGTLFVNSRDDIASDRRLQSVTNPEVTRFLRRGDIVTHVNGLRIDSEEALARAMQGCGGRPRLTVVDRDTGESEEWTTEAIRELTTADRAFPPDHAPHADGIVRAILIAPTGDEKLAAAAQASLAAVRKTLEAALPPERLEVVECVGEECDARGILRAVEESACRERDTLFVYVVARTGFDSRYAIGEGFSTFDGFSSDDSAAPDDGQFLRLKEGDLLRRSLWEAMQMRNARLTILVSDTCDEAAILDAAAGRALSAKLADGSDDAARDDAQAKASRRGWAERLLGHTGSIDVSVAAASAGERERSTTGEGERSVAGESTRSTGRSGWFDPERGGWFTEAWLRSAEVSDRSGRRGWSETLELASRTADESFAARKAILSPKSAGLSDAARARLDAEPNQGSPVRTMDVRADATLDHLPGGRH